MNIAGKLAVAAALIALGACSNVTNPIGGGAGGAGGLLGGAPAGAAGLQGHVATV